MIFYSCPSFGSGETNQKYIIIAVVILLVRRVISTTSLHRCVSIRTKTYQ